MAQIVTSGDLGDSLVITSNQVEVNIDGTTVVQALTGELTAPGVLTTLAYDNVTNILTYTGENGTPVNLDLSGLTTDIYVDGASFDAASSVLTLTDNDGGTANVTVDLSTLLGVSTDANNVLSNGTDGKPFLQSSNICDVVKADCVVNPGTPCTDLAGNTLGYFIAV